MSFGIAHSDALTHTTEKKKSGGAKIHTASVIRAHPFPAKLGSKRHTSAWVQGFPLKDTEKVTTSFVIYIVKILIVSLPEYVIADRWENLKK